MITLQRIPDLNSPRQALHLSGYGTHIIKDIGSGMGASGSGDSQRLTLLWRKEIEN